MKVLIISHAYVERDNHKKLIELSKISGLEIGVIYPSFWRTWHGEMKAQISQPNPPRADWAEKLKPQNLYKEFSLDTFFSGDGGRYFYNPWQLFSAIKKFRPDMIHLEEEPFTPVALETTIFSRLLSIKMIFFSWENIDLSLGLWRIFIEKVVFRSSTAAVVGNLEAKDRVERRGFIKRVEVIPQFGVDAELFMVLQKDHPLEGLSLGSDFTVGFVGRPSLVKGIDTLFQAVDNLEANVRLLIVTSSPSISNEIIVLAKESGIQDRVEFKTSITHSQLPECFNKMDVFVLPSRTTKTWKEQFGRTLIEAMACGIPVIGSSSGAIPEVIGEDGFVFREGDAKDLSKYIEMLEGDSDLWKEMSKRGLESVRKNYSFQKIAEKTAAFYFRTPRTSGRLSLLPEG